tara:strand:+ start:423 stop:665 length:243 start_codon:yes stop_codon:yes gene_type:complete
LEDEARKAKGPEDGSITPDTAPYVYVEPEEALQLVEAYKLLKGALMAIRGYGGSFEPDVGMRTIAGDALSRLKHLEDNDV